ncbi:MAG: SIS domain-containing protein [Gaiellaceae bacterium MAG52_C11]|nr:SIS domain-containing protein [Candidatus Gaiellasilicea maunaloa]
MAESARALSEHLELATRIEELLPRVDEIGRLVVDCFAADGRVYTFGNGGSSLDATHLAEELVGRFKRERRPLPAQSLVVDAATLTCIANDYSFAEVFERQVRAFVRAGDVVVAFSTSGRSPNIVRGLAAAKDMGATTILIGGGEGGPALAHADHALLVPSESTARIQEWHAFFLHAIVDRVDRWAAGE